MFGVRYVCGALLAWLSLQLDSDVGRVLTSFPRDTARFRRSYASNLLPKASNFACTIFITTAVYIAPGAVFSEKPSESMSISPIGMPRALDRDLCCTNSIGYIS